MGIPITQGSGQTSVASEKVGVNDFQQVEIYGGGGASVLSVNPDGSFQASIIGIPAFKVNSSVAVAIISGSIAATFTPPANQSVSGTVQTDVRGSVAVAIISGSIAATFTPPANQSVSGTVQVDVRGSVAVAIISGSIAATFTPPANQSVSGAVGIFGSVMLGSSNGSVLAVITTPAGSVQAVRTDNASVITIFGQSPSLVGTYAEDAASASGDKGFLVMGARNDTLASVTSADGDYSSHVVGPAGELIAENAPLTKWVFGTADFRNGNAGASIIAIATGGSSIFTYITGVQVANMGSASVLVTLAAGGSTLGYTIAPAGGGSNIYYQNALKTPANFGFAASLSGIASVVLSAQGFISKT